MSISKVFVSILVCAQFLSLHFFSLQAQACSAFSSSAGLMPLLAKSYDWDVGHGQIIVNKRGFSKKALLVMGGTAAEWTSKYGSLTFNQHGRDFPLGGINEKGLAVEILWLPGTRYPDPDATPSLNEAQWIQYHLDSAANVAEMVRLAKSVMINPVFAETHYMACDSLGACASFEYLKGQLTITPMNDAKVMTNSEYQLSVENLKNYQGFGGTKQIPTSGYDSKDRFVRLAHHRKALDQMTDPALRAKRGFEMLEGVRSRARSQWQAIYDLSQLRVTFKKLNTANSALKSVNLKNFLMDCQTPVMVLDMDGAGSGDMMMKFKEYNETENYRMVLKSAKALGLPEEMARIVSEYPRSTVCSR